MGTGSDAGALLWRETRNSQWQMQADMRQGGYSQGKPPYVMIALNIIASKGAESTSRRSPVVHFGLRVGLPRGDLREVLMEPWTDPRAGTVDAAHDGAMRHAGPSCDALLPDVAVIDRSQPCVASRYGTATRRRRVMRLRCMVHKAGCCRALERRSSSLGCSCVFATDIHGRHPGGEGRPGRVQGPRGV
jgi:hypothetical protein